MYRNNSRIKKIYISLPPYDDDMLRGKPWFQKQFPFQLVDRSKTVATHVFPVFSNSRSFPLPARCSYSINARGWGFLLANDESCYPHQHIRVDYELRTTDYGLRRCDVNVLPGSWTNLHILSSIIHANVNIQTGY